MNNNLGANIKNLRLKKGWKQEELANFVGVTGQAVSKWETGASLPDISTLPILARSLDTSIDDLLSFDLELSEEEIKKLVDKAVDKYVDKGFKEGYGYTEDLLKEYPNSIGLKFYLGSLFQNFLVDEEYSQQEIKSYYKRAIELYEEVLASGKIEYDYRAKVFLIGYYPMIGDQDSAEAIIETLGDENSDKAFMLASIFAQRGEKEKAKKLYQEYLEKASNKLIMTLNILAAGEAETNITKAGTILKKAVDICEILGIYSGYVEMSEICLELEAGNTNLAVEKYLSLVDKLKKEEFSKKENSLLDQTAEVENKQIIKSMIAKIIKHNPDFQKIGENPKIKLANIELDKMIIENRE